MKKILISGFENPGKKSLFQSLRKEGHFVDSARGMPEVVEKLMISDYDVIVLNMNIDHIKGSEPISVIRDVQPDIFIIAVREKKSFMKDDTNVSNIFYYFAEFLSKQSLIRSIKSTIALRELFSIKNKSNAKNLYV
jgi:DNA-binding NtrC family response regulator